MKKEILVMTKIPNKAQIERLDNKISELEDPANNPVSILKVQIREVDAERASQKERLIIYPDDTDIKERVENLKLELSNLKRRLKTAESNEEKKEDKILELQERRHRIIGDGALKLIEKEKRELKEVEKDLIRISRITRHKRELQTNLL